MLVAVAAAACGSLAAAPPKRQRLGIVIHSYMYRRSAHPESRFDDPLAFLDYCHGLGAGGVQTGIGTRDQAYVKKLRERAEAHQMYLEASLALPKDRTDVERFTADVQTAKDCGITVIRTAMGGRRYELFDSLDGFRRFAEQSWQSLVLAKPVIEKSGLRLAIENHKDWRVTELLDILKRIDSPQIGFCVDTGNSIALLEDPMEVVNAYAPYAFSSHLKDMAVEEYADGFLLAEVPLGTGFLDIPKIVATLRGKQPKVRINLEMITRDPLKIPCLTKKYWATFLDLPGRHLADMMALVRGNRPKTPLPRFGELGKEEKLKLEDDNVRRCLKYAEEKLDL
jgi:sugar phosphate isomerase/epimerase